MTRSTGPARNRSLREDIEMFVAGELPADDVDRVLAAIATDPEAAAELETSMQLRALGHELKAAAPDVRRGEPPVRRAVRRRAALLAGVAGSAATLLVVALTWLGSGAPRVADVSSRWLATLAPDRQLKPRLSWPDADHHRRYDPPRAGTRRVETISFALLADLEHGGDRRALVAAQLLLGNLESAKAELDRSPLGADTRSDRAALALVEGDAERAIIESDAALEQQPDHPQALWNRALALSTLGLDRSAAATFERLAVRNEPGWSDEASNEATALAEGRARRDAGWRHALAAGQAMVDGGPPPLDQVAAYGGLMRLYFYDAVRVARSAARVNELRPLANALDQVSGGHVLAAYADRIAAGSFSRRVPLATRYLALIRDKLDAAQVAALLADLRAAHEDDLLLGALTVVGHENGRSVVQPDRPVVELAAYAALAEATRDPWFELLAAERRAMALISENDIAAAESLLSAVAERCSVKGLAYRCVGIWRRLADIYVAIDRPSAAKAALDLEWRAATSNGIPAETILYGYARIASARDDLGNARHAVPLAYLDEADHSDDCETAVLTRDVAVMALINENRLAQARGVMAKQRRCDTQLATYRAFVLAHLVDPGDRDSVAALRAQIQALRATAKPGELASLDHIEGRVAIRRSPEEARTLLRRAIASADGGVEGAKVRSYSYSVLIQDAARQQRWPDVLQLLAEERGVALPGRCVLGVAEEDAAVFAATAATGATMGFTIPRAVGTPLGAFPVPAEVTAALHDCAAIDVLARQPYFGRAGLLPPDQVWQFLAGSVSGHRTLATTALVVGNIDPPGSLGLPPLNHLQPVAGGVTLLEGARATPAGVLAAIREVGFVEIHSHGLTGGDDVARLVVAPDARGSYALTTSQIAAARLAGAPVVMLAACGAGASGTSFHTTWSLPEAFRRAGARAVIASADPVSDASAQQFFARVRDRISAGASPARALRDERVTWTDPAQRAWIDHLIVFQ